MEQNQKQHSFMLADKGLAIKAGGGGGGEVGLIKHIA
jgi:hypothetical protein